MAPQFDIHINLVREKHGGQKIDCNEFRCNDLGSGLSLFLPRGRNHHLVPRFSYFPSFRKVWTKNWFLSDVNKRLHTCMSLSVHAVHG